MSSSALTTYEPINWQTGDMITAEKMNKMDNGWGITSGDYFLFSETVTTEPDGEYYSAQLSYSIPINDPEIEVYFDNTLYHVPRTVRGFWCGYGEADGDDFDFTNYPFFISSSSLGENYLYTETAGAHDIEVTGGRVLVSPDFNRATLEAVGSLLPLRLISGLTDISEMNGAMSNSRLVYFDVGDSSHVNYYIVTGYSYGYGSSLNFIPENATLTVGFDQNGKFYAYTASQ